jgi:hypothetical protein
MLYPPRDICIVTVPADGRGCGQPHTRPRGADGEPIHPWGLSCSGGCEEHLIATDSRFVRTVHEIPLTHDEAKEVEHLKERGSADRDGIMLAALAKIAGLELPASVARGLPAAAPVVALLACPACSSAQPSGHSFCGSCGSPMRAAVPAQAIAGGVS